MWTSRQQTIDGRTTGTTLWIDGQSLTWSDVMVLWQEDEAFGRFFSDTLAASDFEAFFWECPGINRAMLGLPFEYVLVAAPALARIRADPAPFAAQFTGAPVVAFSNLGGDAMLVVPAPLAGKENYAHLAQFLRTAAPAQVSALWQAVGRALSSRLSDVPIWLSTAGQGVSWLHVRLDARPKYYRHAPYRDGVAQSPN